ncbi:MAG TPA: MFS transporter [Marmoricola sp.]|nr:MFS transporter [Marmoricola sp.]
MADEPVTPPPRRGRRLVDATGRGAASAGRAAVDAGRKTRRATGRAASYTFHQARRASQAEGAGESGLYRLIELGAFNAAGDAAVAVSLAGTIFFANPGEARGNVALFLAITMVPFAVVAPLIGPFLDRFSHGRRWAIGLTMALRAFLCWVMAGAVAADSVWMYPVALGVLVSSKAYGVARAATVPRLMPPSLTLVKANSRCSLAGVVGAAISGPIAAGLATFGSEWSLRYAFVVFAGATVLAILLPARADASTGEEEVSLRGRRGRLRVSGAVVFALRCNAGLRMVSGFLTMFMAFLLRQHPLPGWEQHTTILMGLVIGAAGLGNTVGIGLSSLLRRLEPARTVVAALLVDTIMAVVVATFYGLLTAVLLGLTAGVAQAMGKIALDSTIQREVPERHRTAAFGRSETLLQLSWVIGGFIGIALPLVPHLGLGVLAGLLGGWTVFVLWRRPTNSRLQL